MIGCTISNPLLLLGGVLASVTASSVGEDPKIEKVLAYWENIKTIEVRFHSTGMLVRPGESYDARYDEGFYSYARGGKQYTEYVMNTRVVGKDTKVKVARLGTGSTRLLEEWRHDTAGLLRSGGVHLGVISEIDYVPSAGGFIMSALMETYISRDVVKTGAYKLVRSEKADTEWKLELAELNPRPDLDPNKRPFLDRGFSMSFTLSQPKGFAPIRCELLEKGKPVTRTEYDLKEVKPGLWFPVHAVSDQLNDYRYHHEIWFDERSIRINEAVDKDRYDLPFPSGTNVHDTVENRDYVVP